MTETYTQTILLRKAAKNSDNDIIRLDVDNQLFYDLLKGDLDSLLREPRMGSVDRITSYSRSQRMPLV
ncbi:hypothetical protein [Parapedobacter soli]|uniref:hypothetical protein n=1 Tax=Parapedobacter soli TaxID=416955 RepID=UPI0021C5A26F|nr:hypothetical protein [Parapedobacter soli]